MLLLKKRLNIALPALIIILGTACQPTVKSPSENPYKDDYSDISSLSHRSLWGTANVHDPSVIQADSFYYAYSTDAYYIPRDVPFFDIDEPVGNIQIRRSKDLVNWEFRGWALDTIPREAVAYIHGLTGNKGAENVWAPKVVKYKNIYRLYYSVSTFGKKTSYIGLAEATTPEGPWTDKGCVIKSGPATSMNAIDPSVITDFQNGRMWMHYGSFFSGLHCVELNPQTGKTLKEGDMGHLTATRADRKNKIIEAPEIIYNETLKMYYLFVSYDPLFTFYNVRVGRSERPQGPFYDFFGNDMADTTNNYPILTHSYQFENQPGWSGNGHCGVIENQNGFYMFHQGRLAPDNLMLRMHVREIKWLSSGWPVVSPERYLPVPQQKIKKADLTGEWEIIHLQEPKAQTSLWQGQIPPGGWHYNKKAFNVSKKINFNKDQTIQNSDFSSWQLKGDKLMLNDLECVIFSGWDWENQKPTLLFSSILPDGTGLWGKKR
ncbi:arabinan endo-1,5-alpha-L-arabinosidase [Geofilum sp. OHC36d9]|uniref:arabinan endo-1,5-alpha-L-arabinosidase n=1 Tax=Geofilum sp. OHC36d9 TaxID=3458413 RepID=UPI004033DEB3